MPDGMTRKTQAFQRYVHPSRDVLACRWATCPLFVVSGVPQFSQRLVPALDHLRPHLQAVRREPPHREDQLAAGDDVLQPGARSRIGLPGGRGVGAGTGTTPPPVVRTKVRYANAMIQVAAI
jgi:hypothetical protein